VIAEIKQLEIFAAKHADLVLAVSETDKNFLQTAANIQPVISPNAASPRIPKTEKINFWRQRLPAKFFIFIASAHLPNIIGFLSTFIKTAIDLPPELKIVVVGSVADLFKDYHAQLREQHFDIERLIIVGVVEDEDLTAILSCAHALLIPITVGSGTNLKTAEALLSGKYVISTPMGFRGYGQYNQTPGVFICSTEIDFQTAMNAVWRLPAADFSSFRGLDLTWDYSLDSLIQGIKA
jgi:glycosyltransferase involved in cell wall biosynthesis